MWPRRRRGARKENRLFSFARRGPALWAAGKPYGMHGTVQKVLIVPQLAHGPRHTWVQALLEDWVTLTLLNHVTK